MYRVPYTGVSMSVALVRLHVLIKIFIGPYLRVTLSIHDIDFRAGLVADPSISTPSADVNVWRRIRLMINKSLSALMHRHWSFRECCIFRSFKA